MRSTQVAQDVAAQAQRQRVTLRTIGDSLMGIQSFQASPQYYSFIVENGECAGLEFRRAAAGDFSAQRQICQPEHRARFQSAPRHLFAGSRRRTAKKTWCCARTPVLMDMDQDEQKYPLVLARNVRKFTIECWDTNKLEWADGMGRHQRHSDAAARESGPRRQHHRRLGCAGFFRGARLFAAVGDDAGGRCKTARPAGFQAREARRAFPCQRCNRPEDENFPASNAARLRRHHGAGGGHGAVDAGGRAGVFDEGGIAAGANANDDEKLLWIGRAGVERACWLLAQEPPGPTSLQQIWAGGPGDGPETNGPLAGISLDNFPVGDGIGLVCT